MRYVRNCECKCCHPDTFGTHASDGHDTCTDFEYFYEDMDTPDHCSSEGCSGMHIECPDSGEHNEHGVNEATYHNCVCGCCHPPENGAATSCTNYEYFPWHAPSERHCTAAMCSSRNSECLDASADNEHGVVEA